MASDATPNWEVTGQRPDMGLDADGKFVPGVFVSYKTRSGAANTVFVPQSEYTVERVKVLLADRAATSETIHNLKG